MLRDVLFQKEVNMYIRLTNEQAEHYARHLSIHVNEVKEGNFSKDIEYVDALVQARILFLEAAHDMVYIMREKEFRGYEDADFNFDVRIDEGNLTNHQFQKFDVTSYRVVKRIRNLLEFQKPKLIELSREEAEMQMNVLSQTIIDLSYGILLFQKYFKVERTFIIPRI